MGAELGKGPGQGEVVPLKGKSYALAEHLLSAGYVSGEVVGSGSPGL